jgi:hypothetical protein
MPSCPSALSAGTPTRTKNRVWEYRGEPAGTISAGLAPPARRSEAQPNPVSRDPVSRKGEVMTNAVSQRIVSAWLSGAVSAHGKANPAGPLFAGATFGTVEDAMVTANESFVTANDMFVTANDSFVTANDMLVTANDSCVTANDAMVTANDLCLAVS